MSYAEFQLSQRDFANKNAMLINSLNYSANLMALRLGYITDEEFVKRDENADKIMLDKFEKNRLATPLR